MMTKYFIPAATSLLMLLSVFSCSKDEGDMPEVASPRMYSRIYSLDAPENIFVDTPEPYTTHYLSFFHYEAWLYMKNKNDYKGIDGFRYVTRGYTSVGDGGSELLDSISTTYYGENERFVEGQDSIAQAHLIYRLKSLRVVHVDKTTHEETDVSKDFTITYYSYEKYMKERPKKMERTEDYIYAVTKPLNELTEEDCKWMGWYRLPTDDIYLKYVHKYCSYEPNFKLIIEGNGTQIRHSISGIRWRN